MHCPRLIRNTLLTLATLALSQANIAFAETQALKAADNTQIEIGYELHQRVVPATTDETWIQKLAFKLSNPGTNTAVLLVATCGGQGMAPYHYTINCTRTADDWFHVSQQSEVMADDATVAFIARTLPDLLLRESRPEGSGDSCSFELAVERDGTWLSDPINGSSNFKLQF